MSDINLPITGKDVRLMLIVDGAIVQVNDQITDFDEKPVYDEIVTKVIGQAWSYIDKIPTHWEGSFKIAVTNGATAPIIDKINLNRATRVPMTINIAITYNYRDGSVHSYVYPDAKLEFSTTGTRGSVVSTNVSWKSGNDRVQVL